LKGEETVAEAAGGTVEDLLSGSKAKSSPVPSVKKSEASLKTVLTNEPHPTFNGQNDSGKPTGKTS
jgi:hypothetical protein